MSKTVCIYHSRDLDGWMSAAIVKHWFLLQNPYALITGVGTNSLYKEDYDKEIDKDKIPRLDFIGYNYGQPIPDLSEYDKVIMCDISFPKEEMIKLREKLHTSFHWCDHHISAINDSINNSYEKTFGLRDTKFAACELTWKYFFPNEQMPEIVRLLGRYDCFGHKGTDEHIKVLEFQYGARQGITNYEEAYNILIERKEHQEILVNQIHENGKSIYQYLCTEAKQTYKKAFPIWLTDFTYEENNELVHHQVPFLCVNQERFNPINFGINYHEDVVKGNKEEFTSDMNYHGFACFWYKDGKWMWSLYNDNGEVDCSIIAKQYGGGGHKGAAGFVIDNIDSLKELLDDK